MDAPRVAHRVTNACASLPAFTAKQLALFPYPECAAMPEDPLIRR